jgi:hypothetical protein
MQSDKQIAGYLTEARALRIRYFAGLLRRGWNAVFCFIRAAGPILTRKEMNTLTTALHKSSDASAALCSWPSSDSHANQRRESMPEPPASRICAINDDYRLNHPWPIGGYRSVDRMP